VNQASKGRVPRLRSILRETEPVRAPLSVIRRMREWVLHTEHILSGAWASTPEEITNQQVGRRLDDWLGHLADVLQAEGTSAQERRCLEHLLKVLRALRPWLTHCYDVVGLPRTNNAMELTIRAIKMRYRRISGRKNWNAYLLRYGRCVAYYKWWEQQPGGMEQLEARLPRVSAHRWRQVREQTRLCHRYQLNRYQLRHQPQRYLANLEERWTQALRM
jgi:hypothetical protein